MTPCPRHWPELRPGASHGGAANGEKIALTAMLGIRPN